MSGQYKYRQDFDVSSSRLIIGRGINSLIDDSYSISCAKDARTKRCIYRKTKETDSYKAMMSLKENPNKT